MAVSPEHQIYAELFSDAPDMALAFPRDLGVEVPKYDRSELTSCDLGHVDPVERRSDVAIMPHGKVGEDPMGGLMGVVVEVQRDTSERKRFTWPEYLCALHSKNECPVTLLVICPRQHVADWYEEPIPLGHPGFTLEPVVLGPDRIPALTYPAEVGRFPTLGVLSAAAHGPADPDVIRALHKGLDSIDREMATKCTTGTYEWTSAWTESLKAEGEARGKAEMLLRVLEHKRIEVFEQAREHILVCTDPKQVEAWMDKAFDHPITHADQLFEE